MGGSSPLTRGKLVAVWESPRAQGLIPAHAGKTGGCVGVSSGSGAHPRSRGENAPCALPPNHSMGSSPLTRGKHVEAHRLAGHRGLIPAHAGKTDNRYYEPEGWRAHPRSRGENSASASRTSSGAGSSPLTRGKHCWPVDVRRACGLIPAHAGKTPAARPPRRTPRAHPRSRGENGPTSYAGNITVGSSPLTRGKQGTAILHAAAGGLIPAHAGKTRDLRPHHQQREAHPRSRGENERGIMTTIGSLGSSPLTRGKQAPRLALSGDRGLIPAHAGKTHVLARRSFGRGAHPRSRGENAHGLIDDPYEAGSPPLTRG